MRSSSSSRDAKFEHRSSSSPALSSGRQIGGNPGARYGLDILNLLIKPVHVRQFAEMGTGRDATLSLAGVPRTLQLVLRQRTTASAAAESAEDQKQSYPQHPNAPQKLHRRRNEGDFAAQQARQSHAGVGCCAVVVIGAGRE